MTCEIFVEGVPRQCHTCGCQLCLRQQVINLALGNTEQLLCLQCLSVENQQSREQLLERMFGYIEKRDCFRKEWIKYADVSFCPSRNECVPQICFSQMQS